MNFIIWMWIIIIKLVSTSNTVSSLNVTTFMITLWFIYTFLASHIIHFSSPAIWSFYYRRMLWTKIDFLIDDRWPSRKFKWRIHDIDRTFQWLNHKNCIACFTWIIDVIQHLALRRLKSTRHRLTYAVITAMQCKMKIFFCLVELKTTFHAMSFGQ